MKKSDWIWIVLMVIVGFTLRTSWSSNYKIGLIAGGFCFGLWAYSVLKDFEVNPKSIVGIAIKKLK